MRVGKKCIITCLYLLLTCCAVQARSSDSLMHRLLLRLDDIQTHSDSFFATGVFPSYRKFVLTGKTSPDANIFYSILIGFTLTRVRPQLSAGDKIICDRIVSRVKKASFKYKNRENQGTYNFWPTDTLTPFFHHWPFTCFNDYMHLADDPDDTALMLAMFETADSTAVKVHNYMQQFINTDSTRVHAAMRRYRDIEAYSVWFGKKTKVEVDFSILCNILYMVQQYNLPWTKADSASLHFILLSVNSGDYLKHANKLSGYYKTTPALMYHLARLMSVKPIPALEALKPKLIADAESAYNETQNIMQKVMLRTALLHWGKSLPMENMAFGSDVIKSVENSGFVFYIANLALNMPAFLVYPLVEAGISRVNFYCPAYNDCLLLEYLAEQKKYNDGLITERP